jgi:hypothetical protein
MGLPRVTPQIIRPWLSIETYGFGDPPFQENTQKKHYLYVDQSHPTPWPRYSKGYSRRAPKFRKFGRNRFLDSFLFWLCLIGLTVTSSSRSSCSYENGHKWMFPLPQKKQICLNIPDFSKYIMGHRRCLDHNNHPHMQSKVFGAVGIIYIYISHFPFEITFF